MDFFGSFRCSCDLGWTGTACDQCAFAHEGPNCDPLPCDPECVHGTCGAGSCICEDPGWVGDACDEPRCCDPDCVNGICRGLDVCDCDGGWEGPTCNLQQHLRLDAMVEICGGGDEQDEQEARRNGNELSSLLSQEVTPLGVAGAGVSSVWNAQRVQSSAAATARIQLAATGAGSNISDVLTIVPISDQDCPGSNSACRLKFDFAIVGGPTVSAPLWGDEIARAQTSFNIDIEQFSVSHGVRVRHEWVSCSKIEPCVPGTLCEECEGGSVKLGEGNITQNGFDARICRSEFEPPPGANWLCNVDDTLVSGADASPGSTFSVRARVQFGEPFNLFYSMNTNAGLTCEADRSPNGGCEFLGPGCPLTLCSTNSPNKLEPCTDSSTCQDGSCSTFAFCDIQSMNVGELCIDDSDCIGGQCRFNILPELPAIARADVTLQLLRVSVVEAVVIEDNLFWVEVPATIEATSGFNYLDPGAPIVSPGLLDSPDLDGDGDTDLDDFSALLGFFGGPGGAMLPPGADPSDLFLADQNGDNVVDLHDLAILFAAFGG